MTKIETVTYGGCQCGAIRYEFSGKTINPSICHCRMCQKAFGSYFAPLGGVLRENLKWTRGKPAIFNSSPVAERGFCAQCGTPLTFAYCDNAEINVALGSLDHPETEIPINAYGTEAEMPWFDWLAGLPAHSTDTSTPFDLLKKIKSCQHPDFNTDHWPEPKD